MAPLVEGGEKYLTKRERPWNKTTLDKVCRRAAAWLLHRGGASRVA